MQSAGAKLGENNLEKATLTAGVSTMQLQDANMEGGTDCHTTWIDEQCGQCGSWLPAIAGNSHQMCNLTHRHRDKQLHIIGVFFERRSNAIRTTPNQSKCTNSAWELTEIVLSKVM